MSTANGGHTVHPPISDYAVIGDSHTAALISRDGSIDWYCPVRFDAPAVFCRVLDAERGGYLRIAPSGAYAVSRRYRGPTNILETTFTAADGVLRLTDFMSVHPHAVDAMGEEDIDTSHRILRLVEVLSGELLMELRFKPSFDYACAKVELSISSSGGAVTRAGGQHLVLACPSWPLEPDGTGGLRGEARLRAGERRWATLTYTEAAEEVRDALAGSNGEEELAATLGYWQAWAARCTYRGPYRDAVLRSALTLKLLTYEPTGAVVAAPTTSLPEEIGGERNWDYRFTWLRDSALILYALTAVGYNGAPADFFHWLRRTQDAHPMATPQIMYAIDGNPEIPEGTLDHLVGYRNSRPVRVGNGAVDQLQLDIFGDVLTAAEIHYLPGADCPICLQEAGGAKGPPPKVWALLRGLVDQAAARWQEPDNGIWEVRGGRQLFLFSRQMCWVALDRGIRLAELYKLPAPLAGWRQTRDTIRRAILTQGYNTARGAFTQAFGSATLDASALTMPIVGFLPATDPRVRSTIERIRAELCENGLVYRYRTSDTDDGVAGDEASFAVCSYWMVMALALGGRLDEAQALFETLLGYANDVGLLAEEIDAKTGALLGNFPQGFTHLGLIRSAVTLDLMARRGSEDQPTTEAERLEGLEQALGGGAGAG